MRGFEEAAAPLVVIHGPDESGTCAFGRKGDREGVRCTFAGGRFDGFRSRHDFREIPPAPARDREPGPD